jgi:hypothetical protein
MIKNDGATILFRPLARRRHQTTGVFCINPSRIYSDTSAVVRDFFKDDILIIKSFCGVEGISSKENGVSSWRSKTGR